MKASYILVWGFISLIGLAALSANLTALEKGVDAPFNIFGLTYHKHMQE